MKFRNLQSLCLRIGAAGVLTAALAGSAHAQKLALINVQEAILATSDGKKAAAEIDAKFAPVKAELDKMQADLAAKQDQLSKGRGTMSAAAQASLSSEIDSLNTAMTRKREDAQQDFQQEENRLLGGVMQKLQQTINAYCAANQINLVVDMSANPNTLIYGDAKINITPQVIAAYEGTASEAKPAAAAPQAKPAASAAAPAPKPAATRPAAPKPAAPAK